MKRVSYLVGIFAVFHVVASVGSQAFSQSADADIRFAKGAIDEPDESFAAQPKTPTYRAFLPASVDLSRFFPQPGDQGKQSSCVGWAVGYAARAYYAISQEHRPGEPRNIPSPAYVYNSILSTPGNCDTGSSIPDALNLLKAGALSMSEAPYDARRCMPPSVAEKGRANDFRIGTWLTVDPSNPDQIKGELAQGHPVVISLISRPSFDRLRGDVVYQAKNEASDGNHAITVVGYDDTRQAFKVINSWGLRWGNRGYGWIGYATFVKDVRRAYVMRPARGENPEPPKPPAPKPVPAPQPSPVEPKVSFDFVKCGLVTTHTTNRGAEITGFVGTLVELKEVEERAKQLKAANVNVSVRQWPQCEALMTLARGLKSGDRPKIKVVRPAVDTALVAGAPFVIELESPSEPSFLHVTYVQADGKAVHLLQPETLGLATTSAKTKLTLGDGRDGGPKFTVSAPFGEESVIVIASKAPLFTDKRPMVETEREFLTALRSAVMARPDASAPLRVFSADFDAVKTVEKKQ